MKKTNIKNWLARIGITIAFAMSFSVSYAATTYAAVGTPCENNSICGGGEYCNTTSKKCETIELQRGGKLIATASADIFNSSSILKEDNKYLFINQIQWLLDFQHQISFDNFVVAETQIDEGSEIHVQITVYGDNDSAIDSIHVWVVVLELKADRNQEDLINSGDNRNFNGSIIPADTIKANFVDVTVRMHKRGYGYNETQLYQVFMQPEVGRPIEIDYIALIVFIISLGLVAVGGFATIRYKGKEEEA